jgi:hypothetical protein
MLRHRCSSPRCMLPMWRECETCHRGFCDSHARWSRKEFVRGSWATFKLACYDCVPRTVEKVSRLRQERRAAPSLLRLVSDDYS